MTAVDALYLLISYQVLLPTYLSRSSTIQYHDVRNPTCVLGQQHFTPTSHLHASSADPLRAPLPALHRLANTNRHPCLSKTIRITRAMGNRPRCNHHATNRPTTQPRTLQDLHAPRRCSLIFPRRCLTHRTLPPGHRTLLLPHHSPGHPMSIHRRVSRLYNAAMSCLTRAHSTRLASCRRACDSARGGV
jgi:hypothetical protein